MFFTNNKRELVALICSVFILIFGFAMSTLNSDWGWLERSGSLLVVVALCFLWQDEVIEKENMLKKYSEIENRSKKNTTPLKPGMNLKGKRIIVTPSLDLDSARDDIKRSKKRGRNIEIGLGVFGTVVWGYAGPLFNLFFPFQ